MNAIDIHVLNVNYSEGFPNVIAEVLWLVVHPVW